MSFTIKGATKEVWSCKECNWCQTKKHFRSTEDGPTCLLCDSTATKVSEIEPSVGMSSFKYRELQEALREDASGVGDATVENIVEHFEDGDDFLDAAEAAYQEMELDALKAVDGVGQASAKEIATTIAEREGWQDGALFVF